MNLLVSVILNYSEKLATAVIIACMNKPDYLQSNHTITNSADMIFNCHK